MQVHELAERTAVSVHGVRYYARLGLLRPTRDPRNKYKVTYALFHGLDLALLKPPGGRPMTLGQFVYGLVGAAGVSFAVAASLAGFYNFFVHTFNRSRQGPST